MNLMKMKHSENFCFLGNSLNITYFGRDYSNKYLHNNIMQELIKSKLIFFNFQMKDSKNIMKIF